MVLRHTVVRTDDAVRRHIGYHALFSDLSGILGLCNV